MFRQRGVTLSGKFSSWPWPTALPLSKSWYVQPPKGSIAEESRTAQIYGDLFVVALLLWSASVYSWNVLNKRYTTRLQHLTGHPPAIMAESFDFKNDSNNRRVTRQALQTYKESFVAARSKRQAVEDIIFDF